jgi:hypothetical protein
MPPVEAPAEVGCGCGQEPCTHVDTIEADATITTVTGQPDHEVEMAHKQLHRTAKQSQSLADRLHDMEEANLPAWVQAKITMASDYISKVHGFLDDYLSGVPEQSTEIAVMKEEVRGNALKSVHDVEIELNITNSDMKKLHEGGEMVLKDKTGTNNFTITVKALR